MIYLQLTLLICIVQRMLEVFSDPILAELLLYSVDNRLNPLNVTIEDVTLLQALESDLTLVNFATSCS